MDFDPLTADYPSRNITLEDDEAAYNLNMKEIYVQEPTIAMGDGSQGDCNRLVVLCGTSASCLEETVVDGEAIGTITMPVLSYGSIRSDTVASSRKGVSKVYRGMYSDIVICMETCPSQEQAVAWTECVMGFFKPSSVVVVGSTPGYQFKGEIDGSNGELLCSVRSSACVKSADAPELPLGNVLGGIEAALMLHCELQNIPAQGIIVIEIAQCPKYDLLCELGGALMSVLGQNSTLGREAKAVIKKSAARKYASSADLSVYT
eukprot:jgi/Picre1/33836/NNA_001315.t1